MSGYPPLDTAATDLMHEYGASDTPSLRLPILIAILDEPDSSTRRIIDIPPAVSGGTVDDIVTALLPAATGGEGLTSGHSPLPAPTGLLALYERRLAPPGHGDIFRIIDGIDVTGHTVVISARLGTPATVSPLYPARHQHWPDPAALRHLLYALTHDERITPDPVRHLAHAWNLITGRPPHEPHPSAGINEPESIAHRATQAATAYDQLAAHLGQRIDWPALLQRVTEHPDHMAAWLDTAARILANDLFHILVSTAFTSMPRHLETAEPGAETFLRLLQAHTTAAAVRRQLTATLTADGHRLGHLQPSQGQ